MSIEQYQSNDYMVEEFPFWIQRCVHDYDNTPEAHSHEFIELVYVVEGNAGHIFEGQTYMIQTNDVFIINPGEVHTFRIPPGKKLEIINCLFLPSIVQDSWLKELGVSQSMDYFYIHPFLKENERFHHLLNLDGHHSSNVVSLLEGMIYEYNNENACYSSLIRMKLVELLIVLSRIYNEKKENVKHSNKIESDNTILIQRICGYLSRTYDNKVSIPSLCNLFNISPRHLNRLFKQETGKTVIEMVHKIRIEKAKQLLKESDHKVINVALRVGYEDPAFFSRLFRKLVGCSPGNYRKSELKSIS